MFCLTKTVFSIPPGLWSASSAASLGVHARCPHILRDDASALFNERRQRRRECAGILDGNGNGDNRSISSSPSCYNYPASSSNDSAMELRSSFSASNSSGPVLLNNARGILPCGCVTILLCNKFKEKLEICQIRSPFDS